MTQHGGNVSEPTMAEVIRRLDDVAKAVERIVSTLELSYVRRDLYEAKHDALRSSLNGQVNDLRDDMKELNEARKADQAFRRQILAGAAVGIILLLVNLAMATANTLARVGG